MSLQPKTLMFDFCVNLGTLIVFDMLVPQYKFLENRL